MTSRSGLLDVVEHLAQELTVEGITLDADQCADLGVALTSTDLLDPAAVQHSAQPICCRSAADIPGFARAFRRTFRPAGHDPIRADPVPEPATRPGDGGAGQPTPTEAEHLARTAHRAEHLRHRELVEIDPGELADWFAGTAPHRARRRRRRWRRTRAGDIDLRRTLARWTSPGGNQLAIARHRRRRTHHHLTVVIDVSGSMRSWAPAYLLLAHALVVQRPHTRVFSLATRLTDITAALADPDPDGAQRRVNALVPDWSSGTRLGDLLDQVVDRITGRPVLVVISDGWEQGGVESLSRAAAALARRSRSLRWVAPAAGRADYEPATRGMQAVLPHLTGLHPGTTPADLEDLLELLGEDRA